MKVVQVWNVTKGTLVCPHCLVVETWWQRFLGLMGRKHLPPEEGLLLVPATGGIHTFFLRFPIDVAYLARDGKVVALRANLSPWRLWLVLKSDAVMALELPSGRLQETNTHVGDQLIFCQVGSPY